MKENVKKKGEYSISLDIEGEEKIIRPIYNAILDHLKANSCNYYINSELYCSINNQYYFDIIVTVDENFFKLDFSHIHSLLSFLK